MMQSQTLIQKLPPELKERVRITKEGRCRSSFVLYWMCTAMRTSENPALDAAIHLANTLSIPLLVYQGLSFRYPFASDRHHTFILEGARDVQKQLHKRNIPYVFHLERPESPPVLNILSNMSAMVITEDMPIPHLREWRQKLAEAIDVPFWSVDTACVLPMSLSSKTYERAYTFRDDFLDARQQRIHQEWLDIDLEKKHPLPILPFEPIDLQTVNINTLIAQLPIDHSIPPIQDTKGGSIAGYTRWSQFVQSRLDTYHHKRNDPNAHGTSRMSAYLHYGQVSPFRLAREATHRGGNGAEKFLDELLIWRELCYHWCDRIPHPHHWNALPLWAQSTLEKESKTTRTQLVSWEDLLRAKSPDPVWNLAQQSLLRHGELHNNLRMTWGKRLHKWTNDPKQTLRWLIDLNNRLALDGRDPASYGGLLWCLGLFDHPFPPAQPVFGTVRTRDGDSRIDLKTYEKHIQRNQDTQTTAIIGAGISGLICARTLQDQGYKVSLFDKARGVGGRSSTRISREDKDWVFDHGLPFLQYTDPRFRLWIKAWENAGVIQRWEAKIIDWSIHDQRIWNRDCYVGTPKNCSLAEHLSQDLTCHTNENISNLRYAKRGWILTNQQAKEFGPFDRVILSLPPEQLASLLPQRLHFWTKPVQSSPQHAFLARFSAPLPVDWDGARMNHPVFSWMSREASKPKRPSQEQWTFLTQPSWSQEHLEEQPESLFDTLYTALQEIIPTPFDVQEHQIHRWRYAQASKPLSIGSWWNPEYSVGVCGDWMHGGGVEGAFLSGIDLAGRIIRR